MKIGKLLTAGALFIILAAKALAIEGLQVSLQSSNVVLSWPSDPSQYYIVQYRPILTSTNAWQTLISDLPGNATTNITFFVHTNGAQFGSAGTGSTTNIGPIMPGGGGSDGTNTEGTTGLGLYQVVQDGVRISNASMFVLTNGNLSNSVNIAFEAGNAYDDGTGTNVLGNIQCAYILIDGQKYPGDGGVLNYPANSFPWQFSMDTAYLNNGTHTLEIGVSLINPDNSDGNNVNIRRISDPVSITVSNAIFYPNWEPEIGEMGISAYFLQTIYTNTNWQIDIYDSSNNLAQSLTGYTTDGTIEAYWDMVDTNGVTRTNADVDPEFSAVVTVADPVIANTPKKKQRKRNWPAHGVWTVAYLDFFKFEYSANNQMMGAINTFANTAGEFGGYYLYYPPSGSTNDIGQTYPLRYQKTNHPDTNITSEAISLDASLLLNMLASTNSRNFFYDGHGGPNSIAYISSDTIAAAVNNRYRFVMLDACETGNGDLDAAFGIHGPGQFSPTYYENTGIRPAAFCGYTTDVNYAVGGPVTHNGVVYDDTIPSDVPYFITNFLFYWNANTEGERLQDAINDAGEYLNPVNGQYREDYWAIYGYNYLRIDEDNHASDTW